MSKKWVILSAFFLVLVLAFLITLANYGNGEILQKRYRTVSNLEQFSFVNQNGVSVTKAELSNKVVLVNYFFTTCQTVCPIMNNTLNEIYEPYRNNADFLVLSHTAMPQIDSVPVLKKYADSMKVGKNWLFVTGSKKDLYAAARNIYKLDDPNQVISDPNDDFIHTQLFALVNKKGQIKKKIYDSFNAKEMQELKEDIKLALAGEL
jgi:protein SCO1